MKGMLFCLKSKGFDYYKLLSGGHDAMISKPQELSDIFQKLKYQHNLAVSQTTKAKFQNLIVI